MSARDLYEYILIELRKENAPNILLEDFNYFVNKAINQYVNKRYNIYDINQLTTDDLRVLKNTAYIDVTDDNLILYDDNHVSVLKATYKIELPDDYLHMLNCICNYELMKPWRCYDLGTFVPFPATKLTADLWGQVVNNYWNKPTYRRPYYYIHNKSVEVPIGSDADYRDGYKEGLSRYGNRSKIFCEIRYGSDNSTFKLRGVYIDYIKVPEFIRLTQDQIDLVQDTSLVLEFPDYVCLEIVNELVHIIMENISDLRLQTHPVVSLSIANPTQTLTPESAG